jgi:hydroxymethylglutaryl-CoA lyase
MMPMVGSSKFVHLMEVGPRDGLQIESRILSVDQKLELLDLIADAGITEIEVGSFVNPKAVPQMADTEEVFTRLTRRAGVSYRGLWLNPRGLERAVATGNVDVEGTLYLTASEIFVKRNTNRSIEETFEQLPSWIRQYRKAGIKTDHAAMMAAFGCNFEGDIPLQRVVDMIARLHDLLGEHDSALTHLSLADTMGWANPNSIKAMIQAIKGRWPDLELKLHLHDTRGTAMANAAAAIEEGVRAFDGSIGGLGGCPFAGHKGAAGNICTEDLAFMCDELGFDTGVDLDKLVAAARLARDFIGHDVPGKLISGGTLRALRRH